MRSTGARALVPRRAVPAVEWVTMRVSLADPFGPRGSNEMNRAAKLMDPVDRERLRHAYERVLALADLTIQVHARRGLRRELVRWRDLVARLYVATEGDPAAHAAAFRVLLRFSPEASRQIPHVLRSPGREVDS